MFSGSKAGENRLKFPKRIGMTLGIPLNFQNVMPRRKISDRNFSRLFMNYLHQHFSRRRIDFPGATSRQGFRQKEGFLKKLRTPWGFRDSRRNRRIGVVLRNGRIVKAFFAGSGNRQNQSAVFDNHIVRVHIHSVFVKGQLPVFQRSVSKVSKSSVHFSVKSEPFSPAPGVYS